MELKTKKGLSFWIDDEDYEKVKDITWYVNPDGYVRGYCKVKKAIVNMHRLLLDAPKGMLVDHKDRNPSNNRRKNIRLCTDSENQRNKKSSGKSKYLGVKYQTVKRKYNSKKWGLRIYILKPRILAAISINGKYTHLGIFKTEEDAAREYDRMAKIHHGEFANLNFPNE